LYNIIPESVRGRFDNIINGIVSYPIFPFQVWDRQFIVEIIPYNILFYAVIDESSFISGHGSK